MSPFVLVELEFGEVVSMEPFDDYLDCVEAAEELCGIEGLDFTGDLSYHDIHEYAVQIFCVDPFIEE